MPEATASLHVHADHVSAVLLADGWHEVTRNSFTVGPFEFFDGYREQRRLDGPETAPVGFAFDTANGDRFAGPLTSILAVRHREWLEPIDPTPSIPDELAASTSGRRKA
jgi:hypothetical protein